MSRKHLTNTPLASPTRRAARGIVATRPRPTTTVESTAGPQADVLQRRAELLGHRMPPRGAAEAGRLQREPVYHKPAFSFEYTKTEKVGIDKSLQVDKVVDQAYGEFMDGNYKGASKAQIELYLLRKYQFDQGLKTMHPSTAAGYVIEGKVNSVIGSWKGVSTQVTKELPGTRPDVSIQIDDKNLALVDITASNSAGHILNKKGNWLNHKHIPVVIESIYPSIDFKSMAKVKLSSEELKQVQERIKSDKEAKALAAAELEAMKQETYTQRQNLLLAKGGEMMKAFRNRKRGNKTQYRIKLSDRRQGLWNACGLRAEIDTSSGFKEGGAPVSWDVRKIPYEEWLEGEFDRTSLQEKTEMLLDGMNLTIGQLS